jgi:hypothetical protein
MLTNYIFYLESIQKVQFLLESLYVHMKNDGFWGTIKALFNIDILYTKMTGRQRIQRMDVDKLGMLNR